LSVSISTPYERGISIVFPLQRRLLGIVLLHPKYLLKVTHPRAKRLDFNQVTNHCRLGHG